MTEKYLLIRWPNGAEGAVLPGDFSDPEKAEGFKGARILRWESGEEYHGPTTPEGLARKEEREEEEDFQAALGDEPAKPASRRRAAKD